MKQLWPKYLQVGMTSMGKELKKRPQKLEAEEF
jgi:hypothetical protein